MYWTFIASFCWLIRSELSVFFENDLSWWKKYSYKSTTCIGIRKIFLKILFLNKLYLKTGISCKTDNLAKRLFWSFQKKVLPYKTHFLFFYFFLAYINQFNILVIWALHEHLTTPSADFPIANFNWSTITKNCIWWVKDVSFL